MADFADQPFHIRSNSMPSTSHPISQRVEEELCKLRVNTSPSSSAAETICTGLRGLGDLYESIDELLRLSSSQQCLQTCQKKLLEEQLDCSLRLLDLVGDIKESFTCMREHVQDLQSAIRRKGNMVNESKKKSQKKIKDCVKSLKQISRKSIPCTIDNNNDQLIRVLAEAREITISVFGSVLSFISMPKSKASRWYVISKAASNRKVACAGVAEEETMMCLEASYECIAPKDVEATNVQKAHNQLQALDIRLESLESGLDFLFRHLIQNRVSLLNILSL